MGAVAQLINIQDPPMNSRVSEVIHNGAWHIEMMQFPEFLAEQILSVDIGDQNSKDYAIWTPNSNGIFSTASAWSLARQRKEKSPLLKKIWNNYIPFKMSFLMWKLLKNKLPFDDILYKFKQNLASKCFCCRTPRSETIQHSFMDGDIVVSIWKYFGSPLGISWEDTQIRNFLKKWWSLKPKNSIHQILLQTTPMVVCWEIWKARCAERYGNTTVSLNRIKYHIFSHLKWILFKVKKDKNWGTDWFFICDQIINLVPKIECIMVKWEKSKGHGFKLNTDGSKMGNGQAGAGGICRDVDGNIIMAFPSRLGNESSNTAEAKAALQGLKWCSQNGIHNLILEGDSQLIINMLTGVSIPPWHLKEIIIEAQGLAQKINCRFQHCYRETN
ncbi:uncharacterized protein LOC132612272 [Lycium barbarum]|uniref:uncharacterized protein LOC132612272 n=1 Tax=Lycium barbarum TaxID=112863 RepID=UPI00293E625D|nr:uncharacterized protein LOC132612272 [Lycium barbarum]